MTVIATQPLTNNEVWQKMKPGELQLFHLGETVNQTALQSNYRFLFSAALSAVAYALLAQRLISL